MAVGVARRRRGQRPRGCPARRRLRRGAGTPRGWRARKRWPQHGRLRRRRTAQRLPVVEGIRRREVAHMAADVAVPQDRLPVEHKAAADAGAEGHQQRTCGAGGGTRQASPRAWAWTSLTARTAAGSRPSRGQARRQFRPGPAEDRIRRRNHHPAPGVDHPGRTNADPGHVAGPRPQPAPQSPETSAAVASRIASPPSRFSVGMVSENSTSPAAETTPAAVLVPPRSTPIAYACRFLLRSTGATGRRLEARRARCVPG